MNIIQRLGIRLLRIRNQTTTLRNPASWLLEAFGLFHSAAGIRVSENVALSLSPYYCGLNMISGTIGTLPLNVYRRTDSGRELAPRHPLQYILHDEPNPEMTAASMRQTMVAHAIGHGNAYAEIVRGGNGMTMQLWPLVPNRTFPRRDEEGMLWYEIRLETGEHRFIHRDNVLHVPGLGYDGVMGYSLLRMARDSIGLHAAAEQYSSKFFANGGHVSATLNTDQTLQEPTYQRLKKEVAEKMGGLDNAHRIQILEAGLKLVPGNIDNEKSQLTELRRFTIEDWARWLNMPPHKLKDLTRAHFNNVEQQNIEWVVDCLRPWLVRFEQEYNRKLFNGYSGYYAEHVVDGLLRGDQKARSEAYQIARFGGWINVNEIREKENMNGIGSDGDVYLVPANMTTIDLMESRDTTPVDQNMSREDQMTQNAVKRLLGYEARNLKAGNISYASSEEFLTLTRSWMAIPDETAAYYARVTAQLNLLAEEYGIDKNQIIDAKAGFLAGLAKTRTNHESKLLPS